MLRQAQRWTVCFQHSCSGVLFLFSFECLLQIDSETKATRSMCLCYEPFPRTVLLQNHSLSWNWPDSSSSLVFQAQHPLASFLICFPLILALHCLRREKHKRFVFSFFIFCCFHGQVTHGIISPNTDNCRVLLSGCDEPFAEQQKAFTRGKRKGCLWDFIPICQLSSSKAVKPLCSFSICGLMFAKSLILTSWFVPTVPKIPRWSHNFGLLSLQNQSSRDCWPSGYWQKLEHWRLTDCSSTHHTALLRFAALGNASSCLRTQQVGK